MAFALGSAVAIVALARRRQDQDPKKNFNHGSKKNQVTIPLFFGSVLGLFLVL
jgi:hypothetical protein